MNAYWLHGDRERWNGYYGRTTSAMSQDWAYGESMRSLGSDCLRVLVEDADGPLALAQFTWRRFGAILGMALCSRGPVWLRAVDSATRERAYRCIRQTVPRRWPRLILFSPDDSQDAAASRTMRQVMTGYSTVELDLTAPLADLRAGLHGKWRNRLVGAERSALRAHQNGTKPSQLQWLLAHESEQRSERAYHALPPAFVSAWQAQHTKREDGLLVLRADIGRDAAAGMLMLLHGRAATYFLGWSSPQGKQLGAHNLLLWRAIEMLKSRGTELFDLGGVNTQRGAGIARFKIGTGGTVRTLAGTFT